MKSLLSIMMFLGLGLIARAEATDISAYENIVYAQHVSAIPGATVTMSIQMNNSIPMTGFQFDVILPEGVTAAVDEDDFYLIELSAERTTAKKTDYFNSVIQADGSIRVMCSSTRSYTFNGTSGEVATIVLKLAEDLIEGVYPVVLKNIVMSDASSKTYKIARVESALTIEEANRNLNIIDGEEGFSVAREMLRDTITYTRSYNGGWESLYLPFSVDYEKVCDDFDLAEIVGINHLDEDGDDIPDLTILEIKRMISGCTEPNVPYLIRSKSAGEQTISLFDWTVYPTGINSIDCSSVQTKYTFTGTYDSVAAEDLYVILDGELQITTENVAPFRWYMKATSRKGSNPSLPCRIKILTMDEVIDGVSDVSESSDAAKPTLYNLNGQQINSLRKGINIVGNKKVLGN